VSKNYEQIHQLVWCKDFIQDCIFGHLNNKPICIYNFSYTPGVSPPVYLHKTRLIVTNWKDKEFGKKMIERVVPLLHSIEVKLKMPKTKIAKCKGVPPIYGSSGVWLLEGSKRWMKAPPMISMYTFLIRVGLVHDPKDNVETTLKKIYNGNVKTYYDAHSRDMGFAQRAENGIKEILKYGDRKIFPSKMTENYPAKIKTKYGEEPMSIYNIHDRAGIIAFSEGKTKNTFPMWHKY
jgi:hypothetical protein